MVECIPDFAGILGFSWPWGVGVEGIWECWDLGMLSHNQEPFGIFLGEITQELGEKFLISPKSCWNFRDFWDFPGAGGLGAAGIWECGNSQPLECGYLGEVDGFVLGDALGVFAGEHPAVAAVHLLRDLLALLA